MDIVLGVSMTPTTVRMVLVEGENADGTTVDHDAFEVTSGDASATASEQVVAAILGTRESATEGGHRMVSTGVTWRDHDEAAALRDALAARKIDNVMLVSELHAAGALAQAVGRTVGYDRTALMFLERDTATLSVVQTSDGSIVKVESQDLHTDDAVAELATMVAGLEHLENPPQGVFVVGSGVSPAAIKLQLESATTLPVSAPEESELALARGAALASASAPLFEASTVGLGSVEDADTQMAAAGYMAAPASLAYSEVIDGPLTGGFGPLVDNAAAEVPESVAGKARKAPAAPVQGRKPFLLVGSAMTSIFVLGVTALVISLAVSIRPTVDQRPNPGEAVIVPTEAPAAPAEPEAAVPVPALPAPPPETITAPRPVVQEAPQPQAPRTVFVEAPAPAPAAVAPAPAAPAAPAPAPAPAAPAPAPAAPAPVYTPPPAAPYIPPPAIAPVIPPPVIVLPKSILPPFLQPRYQQPQQQWPQQQQPQWPVQQQQPQWPVQQQQPQWPVQQQPQQQWPEQSGSGRGSGSGDYDGDPGRGSSRGSGGGSDDSQLWPLPIFGSR